MQVISVKLVLNRPVRKTYADQTYWEYMIFESPFDPDTYGAHITIGRSREWHEDMHVEVFFPRHSMVSEEFVVNGSEYQLKLVN